MAKKSAEPPQFLWAQFMGERGKALQFNIATVDGERELFFPATQVIQYDKLSSGWQQIQVSAWIWSKKQEGDAQSEPCPDAAEMPPNGSQPIIKSSAKPKPRPQPTQALAERPAQKQPSSKLGLAPKRADLFQEGETYKPGGDREVPNAAYIQQTANQQQVSTQVLVCEQNKDGAKAIVRAWITGLKQVVEDAIAIDFGTLLEKLTLEALAARPPRIKPVEFENGKPILNQKDEMYLYGLWVRKKNFASRECVTKATARAEKRILNQEWREKEEIADERSELADVDYMNGTHSKLVEPPATEMDQIFEEVSPKKTVKVEMPPKSEEIGGSENFVDRIKRNLAAQKQPTPPAAALEILPVEIMQLGDVATADGWAHVIQEVIAEYGEDSVEAGILTSVDPEELQRLAIILKPVKLVVDDGKAILRLAASLLNPLIIADLKVYIDQCEQAVKDKGITWNEAHWANYFAYFAKQKQLKKSE